MKYNNDPMNEEIKDPAAPAGEAKPVTPPSR
jgi:hypothetical protein